MRLLKLLTPILLALLIAGCAGGPANQALLRGKQAFLQQNYGTAFIDLSRAANYADPNAEYALGYMYYYGLGTPRNEPQAYYWFTKAASWGQCQAKTALAMLQLNAPKDLNFGRHPATAAEEAAIVASEPTVPNLPVPAHEPLLKRSHAKDEVKAAGKVVKAPQPVFALLLYSSTDLGQANIFIQQSKLQGQVRIRRAKVGRQYQYQVLYGEVYKNKVSARAGIKKLPASVQAMRPSIIANAR